MVWSTERFARSVFALRQFLLSSGLAAGDRVAVFAENRPEWHVADFAILLARLGGILQPLLGDLPELRTVVGMEETPGADTSLPSIVDQAPAFDSAAVERI